MPSLLPLGPDELLSTTRAVRKRLDLTRPVEPELIRECIELAAQAPTGSNAQGWHFVVVTDPDKRRQLGEWYRQGFELMYSDPEATPPALMHNLKHNRVLHEHVVLLSVLTAAVPHVDKKQRAELQPLGSGFYRVRLHYGFMEDPNVPRDIKFAEGEGLRFRSMETSYFLGHERLLATRRAGGMALWRERLFALMSRNARNATDFFQLPPNRVVELGATVEL